VAEVAPPEVRDAPYKPFINKYLHRFRCCLLFSKHCHFLPFSANWGEVWVETADPVQMELLSKARLPLVRRSTSRSGGPVALFALSREDALQNPAAWPASSLLSPLPVFGFTRAQQKLLELAFLDHSDREAAQELGISTDGVGMPMMRSLGSRTGMKRRACAGNCKSNCGRSDWNCTRRRPE